MRIVRASIIAGILWFTITLVWYISQPAVIGLSRSLNSTITGANGRNIMYSVEYTSFAWGPLLDIFILVWWLMNAQKRDVESELYA